MKKEKDEQEVNCLLELKENISYVMAPLISVVFAKRDLKH